MDQQDTQYDSTALLASVDALSTAVEIVDAEDLSGLAKMHGFCEQIAEAIADLGSQAEPMKERLRHLVQSLEGLILGETEDAAACLTSVSESIAAINELAATCADATVSPSTDPPTPELSSDPASVIHVEPTEKPAESETDAADPIAATPPDPAPANAADCQEAEVTPDAEQTDAEAGPASASKPPYVSEPLHIDAGEVEFLKGFVEEATEHIENVEAAVLEVEQDFADISRIDDLFRPFHTIKGMAGFLNLRDVNCLTHEVETLLDLGRKGKKAITSATIDLVFEVADVLKVQVAEISSYLDNPTDQVVTQPPVEDLIARLRVFITETSEAASTAEAPAAPQPEAAPVDSAAEAGPVESESSPAATPPLEALTNQPAAPKSEPSPRAAAPAAGSPVQAKATKPDRPVRAAVVSERSLRIDTSKLDAMVDMVGELVIAQTLVTGSSQIMTNPKITRDVSQVTKIIRDIQAVAMGMRMVPVGPTFQKMARLVRDVARKAGKTIELHISGEDTELDKNVIEQIGDPLVHMIRNACDHGIEPPHGRSAAGKNPLGNVWLRASHQGGNIVIEIEDDGKGLDPQKLITKGIERGIVQPGQELTDQQAFQLIFHPGFSMAAEITDISGRGVGMDVVKRNLEQLRGTCDITSVLGKGSTFSIRLPLTLAIIDGMIVRVGSERFIIPTISIEQSLRPKREQLTSVQGRGEILNVRGKLIPLIQLGELFSLSGRLDPCQAMVVIAECEGRSIGLVAKELIGQQQVVIKTLGERFEKLRGISGAAILGDGRVGLILEMSGLVAAHSDNKSYSRIPDTAGDHGKQNVDAADSTELESAAATPETSPDAGQAAETALT